jgi:hypothetical protein
MSTPRPPIEVPVVVTFDRDGQPFTLQVNFQPRTPGLTSVGTVNYAGLMLFTEDNKLASLLLQVFETEELSAQSLTELVDDIRAMIGRDNELCCDQLAKVFNTLPADLFQPSTDPEHTVTIQLYAATCDALSNELAAWMAIN